MKVTADHGVHEPTLSGEGRHNPLDRSRPYQVPNGDVFIMEEDPYSDRHNFIMHASCYSLFAQALHPEPLPVARLLEACRSCLMEDGPFRRLSWGPGHSYGGILNLINAYPWDEPHYFGGMMPRCRFEDPWNLPELRRHLQDSQLDSSITQSEETRWPTNRTIGDTTSNCFIRLPLEILGLILAYTPTDGVKSLARTSKELNIIIPSKLGQSFWASRFQDPFEHGLVFEAYMCKHKLDWKSLYFSITKDTSPRLQSRRRIWGLIQSLCAIIHLQWKDDQGLLPLNEDKNKLRWKEVRGFIQQPAKDEKKPCIWFRHGCIRLYSQSTSIPTCLCRIIVSIVLIGSVTYITGLRFIFSQGTRAEICLGYSNGRELSLETTGLQGFIVAVGSRGIHAIQFVTPTKQLSQWFGDPKGIPKTRRLMSYKPITAIKAGFDVRLFSSY
jgi:hypothetical protein